MCVCVCEHMYNTYLIYNLTIACKTNGIATEGDCGDARNVKSCSGGNGLENITCRSCLEGKS